METKIKFRVSGLDSGSVTLEPVPGTEQTAYPSGRIDLHILDSKVLHRFRKQQEYDVTFTPVEKVQPEEVKVSKKRSHKAKAPVKAPVKVAPRKVVKAKAPVKAQRIAPVKSKSKGKAARRR